MQTLWLIESESQKAYLNNVALAQQGIMAATARAAMPDTTIGESFDTVNVSGMLLPSIPEAYKLFRDGMGLAMTGYDEIEEQIEAALASDKAAILLYVNSGGGMVAGLDRAVNAVKKARAIKPVIAYIDGMSASAAYWITSQATQILATRLSEVGGIGAYSVIYDTTQQAANNGQRAVVARSGNQKGAGIYGDPVTDAMAAAAQENINDIAGMFERDVLATRAVDITGINSGRVWLAARAQELGIIDNIVTGASDITVPVVVNTDEVETKAAHSAPKQAKEVKQMTTKTKARNRAEEDPIPEDEEAQEDMEDETEDTEDEEASNVQSAVARERARVCGITAAFSHDPKYAAACIKSGVSVTRAKADYFDIQQTRGAAADAIGGVAPVASASEGRTEPGDFTSLARAESEKRNIPLHVAAANVARENRAAYMAYVGAKE